VELVHARQLGDDLRRKSHRFSLRAKRSLKRRMLGLPNVAFYKQSISYLLARQQIDCIIDVGAHTGEFARQMRGLGYGGYIVSFEPVAESFEYLLRQAASDPLWFVYSYAIGAQADTAMIKVSANSVYSSLGDASSAGLARDDDMRAVREEKVTVRRLDDAFDEWIAAIPQRPRSIFLKIDTQGWDARVIEGGTTVLNTCTMLQTEIGVEHLYTQTAPWPETIEALQGYGLRLSGFFPVCWKEKWETAIGIGLEVAEFDAVLVRPQS
jgi:FkbM family methyltransferase